MRRTIMALVLAGGIALGGLGGLDGGAQPAAAQPNLPPDAGNDNWNPLFIEDFTGTYEYRGKALWKKNGEQARWKNVSPQRDSGAKDMKDCVQVDNGVMRVKAVPKFVDENVNPPHWNCRITTRKEFSVGAKSLPLILAARVKFHESQGHRSAFWWTHGVEQGGASEIDVFENEGKKTNGTCTAPDNMTRNDPQHWGLNHTFYSGYAPKSGHKHCLQGQNRVHRLYDDQWHTVHAMLTPGVSVKFYIDGVETTTFATSDGRGHNYATSTPIQAILTNSGKSGKDFLVDWVKVWKRKPPATGGTTPVPPPVCDNDCYRAQLGAYTDYHYRENSNPSSPLQARIVFDKKFYVDSYSDVRAWAEGKVAEQGGNIYDHAQWHWLNRGIAAGRQGSATFDPVWYMTAHPDIPAAYGWNNYDAAIRHYVQFGRHEGRRASAFFDPAHYKARYGDMAGASNAAVVDHFTVFGMDEGRQGSAEFGPAYYLATHPDLRAAYGKNYRKAIAHWNSNGRAEGRRAVP